MPHRASREILSHDISNAVIEILDARGRVANLRPLSWTLSTVCETEYEGTHPSGEAHPDAANLCASWAEVLGLQTSSTGDEGFVTWLADLGIMQLSLFAVTDAALYASLFPNDTA
jgi:hypothetical protein